MLKIRLKRYGRNRQPSYRIIVIDSKKKRDGRPIEEIGFYNSLKDTSTLDNKKAEKYIQHGAQITDTVKGIMRRTKAQP